MHTPGSAAHHHAVHTHHAAHHHAVHTHHAAHHRAVDMHHAAHRAAVDHARRSADHGRAAFGAQRVPDVRAGWAAQRGGHPGRARTSGVVRLLRFVFTLAVVAVLVGVVLLLLKPTQPEWLAQLVYEVNGLFRTLRSIVT